MIKVTINDKEYEVEAGKNLIDVFLENKIEIAHYCYHQGLSIAGQCRMCYVQMEGNPKLHIACNMKCSDGLKITNTTPQVVSAVASSLEFHLINHPIDCPICDQAGECGLQDYYMKHGKYDSEMREEKVHKKKVVDIGPKIILDKERCILCSRCVRFTHEISKTDDLVIENRGDRSTIGTRNDQPLKGNYQLNTVDICPVGALTSKDFRFEQRVWYLDRSETVCNGCSKGCNIFVDHKKGRHLYRLKPRFNAEINEWWMCDEGRTTYKQANFDRRLTRSRLGGVDLSFEEAMQNWGADLKVLSATERTDEIGVWLAPHLTHEELKSIIETLKDQFEITKFFSDDIEAKIANDEYVDDLLYRSDVYPNSKGFVETLKAKGITTKRTEDFVKEMTNGSLSHIILFAPDTEDALSTLSSISSALHPDLFVCTIGSQKMVADIFAQGLSMAGLHHYEKNGTVTNHAGISQTLRASFKMFAEARPIEEMMKRLTTPQENRETA